MYANDITEFTAADGRDYGLADKIVTDLGDVTKVCDWIYFYRMKQRRVSGDDTNNAGG